MKNLYLRDDPEERIIYVQGSSRKGAPSGPYLGVPDAPTNLTLTEGVV